MVRYRHRHALEGVRARAGVNNSLNQEVWNMLRTYQPKKRQRSKEHGFMKRMRIVATCARVAVACGLSLPPMP